MKPDFDPDEELIKIVGATAELMGTDLSDAAAEMLVADLSGYPYDQVVGALQRCRQEAKGRLTTEAVLSRLADGRPGPEEAWAMLPANEDQSVVWTDEMARAYGDALPLMDSDPIAARMAFKEVYTRLLIASRLSKAAPKWMLSPGRDLEGRKVAVRDAIDHGRITPERARALLPQIDEDPVDAPRLTGPSTAAGAIGDRFNELREAIKNEAGQN